AHLAPGAPARQRAGRQWRSSRNRRRRRRGSACPRRSFALLRSCDVLLRIERVRDRLQQQIVIELRHMALEARSSAALFILGAYMRSQRDEWRLAPVLALAHLGGEAEAVHARHLDVADDDVEALAFLAETQRGLRRIGADDLVSRRGQERVQHVAQEGAVVDEKQAARPSLAAEWNLGLFLEPVRAGRGEIVRDVDEVGGLAGDDRAAENAGPLAEQVDRIDGLDDVDDLLDGNADRVLAFGEDEDRLAVRRSEGRRRIEREDRHQRAAVLHHRAAVCDLEGRAVEHFEPRDELERQGLGLGAAGAEEDDVLDAVRAPVLGVCRGLVVALLDGEIGERRDAVGIEDHDDAAVAEDGVPRIDAEVAQQRRYRLDDDFLGVEHAIDHDAEALRADLRDDDEVLARLAFLRPAVFRGKAEHLAQRDKRKNLVAQTQHRHAFEALDPVIAVRGGVDQLDHIDLRDGEAVVHALDDQRRDDREGQRNLDDEFRALAEPGAQFDRAADLLDVAAHDVEADAAARDVRDRLRGREARAEDELLDLLLGHRRELGLGGEPVGNGFLADAVGRNAAAVIADLDDDVAADVMRVERDGAGLGLAGGQPLG